MTPAGIANARMYSADPQSTAAWKEVLRWVVDRASQPLEVIDYPPPQPLAALWARNDLGAVFMCGLPFSLSTPAPQMLAAPVPSPSRYGNRAQYMTDLVVRADSPHWTIEDTFGGVAGYTVRDSQSGFFAFRRFLAPWHAKAGGNLYRGVIGDLIHARGVIEALAAGTIDVGPLDSYYHDLLKHNAPGFAAQVRTIATTEPTPNPAFIASPGLAPAAVAELRRAFVDAGSAGELAPQRETLLLAGFAVPDPADYAVLGRRHHALIASKELW